LVGGRYPNKGVRSATLEDMPHPFVLNPTSLPCHAYGRP
jgi:hypothetical protein